MLLAPVMKLINGPTVADALNDPENAITKLVATQSDDAKVVEELYLRFLARRPTAAELAEVLPALDGVPREDALRDLAWALLNSKEFAFNH
mgnify:CR=1 FL=1